jgi:hypothetical protein
MDDADEVEPIVPALLPFPPVGRGLLPLLPRPGDTIYYMNFPRTSPPPMLNRPNGIVLKFLDMAFHPGFNILSVPAIIELCSLSIVQLRRLGSRPGSNATLQHRMRLISEGIALAKLISHDAQSPRILLFPKMSRKKLIGLNELVGAYGEQLFLDVTGSSWVRFTGGVQPNEGTITSSIINCVTQFRYEVEHPI